MFLCFITHFKFFESAKAAQSYVPMNKHTPLLYISQKCGIVEKVWFYSPKNSSKYV